MSYYSLLGPNAIRALKELGILDSVLAKAEQDEPDIRPFSYISGLGEHEHIYDVSTSYCRLRAYFTNPYLLHAKYKVGPEDVGLAIYRPAFLDALVHLVDPAKTHFDKRCTALSSPSDSTSGVKLHFADGSKAEADVVLGADGIRSVVRSFVVENGDNEQASNKSEKTKGLARAKFTNTTAYRGLVPVQKLKDIGMKVDLSQRPHCWIGHDKVNYSSAIQFAQISDTYSLASNYFPDQKQYCCQYKLSSVNLSVDLTPIGNLL